MKDAADFHKKQVKMNTRQLYTQQKYNLFRVRTAQHSTQSSCRHTCALPPFWATTLTTHCLPPLQEETEGYSKLIAELSELPSAGGADLASGRRSGRRAATRPREPEDRQLVSALQVARANASVLEIPGDLRSDCARLCHSACSSGLKAAHCSASTFSGRRTGEVTAT